MIKVAYIKKINNKWRVFSEKGKNLGTYDTKQEAEKRLKQIHWFKYKKASVDILDLTEVESFTYSAFLRVLRRNVDKSDFLKFLKIYKKEFDHCVEFQIENTEKISLQKTLIKFNKTVMPIKINKSIVKNAALTELGNPQDVGKYLAEIVKFITSRISETNRSKSLANLKLKINNLDLFDISNKKLPSSASLGQSITFIKHVLFGHDARYIKMVLENIVKNI